MTQVAPAHPLGERPHLVRNHGSWEDGLHLLLEDAHPFQRSGQRNLHLPSEARKDRIVQHVAAVGRANHPDAGLWSDTVPLCQECLYDVGGDDIRLRRAAAAEDALALVEEDHRRLVVPRLIPYLAHTLPAGSKLLLLEVGDRELLEVALHRLGQAASDQRLACARRSGQEQSARSGLVPNLEHIGPLQQLVSRGLERLNTTIHA
jgi:hypothetical protein